MSLNRPFIDESIEFDVNTLPKYLVEAIKELEKYDAENDWFNYDLKFDELEISAKSCVIHNQISEGQYTKILQKYGGLYD